MHAFEIHLEVEAASRGRLERFAMMTEGSLLCLDLVGAPGSSVATNVNWTVSGTFAEARSHAESLTVLAAGLGIEVRRVKIEAPMVEPVEVGWPATRYFELHVRVRVPDRTPALERVVRGTTARVSVRARRSVGEGRVERYVNLRGASFDDASIGFDTLVEALGVAGIPIVKVHRERVLVDTNLDADVAWLPVAAIGLPA